MFLFNPLWITVLGFLYVLCWACDIRKQYWKNDDQYLVKTGDGESMSLYVPRHMICGKGRCHLTGRKPLNLSLVIEAPFSSFFVSFLWLKDTLDKCTMDGIKCLLEKCINLYRYLKTTLCRLLTFWNVLKVGNWAIQLCPGWERLCLFC